MTTAHLFEVGPGDVALTSDDWYTPRWIFDAAGLVFDLDVCAPVDPQFRTCPARKYLTIVQDGLTSDWHGLVWMNPPYSKPMPWVSKWAVHPDGLALVPAAASTWRRELLLAADGMALITVKSRGIGGEEYAFGRPDGSRIGYPMALILAARGERCVSVLGRVSAADPYSGGAYHVRPPKVG